MKTAQFLFRTAAVAFLLIPGVHAHHGWTVFESEKKIELKGVVRSFHFVSPHSVIEIDVKDDKGQMVTWEGEMSSPSHLAPRGWSAASVEAGDVVTMTGFPAKNGSKAIRVSRVVLANGKELKLSLTER